MFGEVSGGTTSNTHFRNNLILAQNSSGFGGPAGGGDPPQSVVFGFTTYTNYSSSDYNGFSPNANAPYSFQWNSPTWEVPADFASRGHNAQTETRRYKTLEEYQQATKQDAHSLLVDYDTFMNVPRLGRDVKTSRKSMMRKFRLPSQTGAAGRPGVARTLRTLRDARPTWAIEWGRRPPWGALV
jgi:hypothetical protein